MKRQSLHLLICCARNRSAWRRLLARLHYVVRLFALALLRDAGPPRRASIKNKEGLLNCEVRIAMDSTAIKKYTIKKNNSTRCLRSCYCARAGGRHRRLLLARGVAMRLLEADSICGLGRRCRRHLRARELERTATSARECQT